MICPSLVLVTTTPSVPDSPLANAVEGYLRLVAKKMVELCVASQQNKPGSGVHLDQILPFLGFIKKKGSFKKLPFIVFYSINSSSLGLRLALLVRVEGLIPSGQGRFSTA